MSSYLTFSPLPENRRLFSAALAVSLAAAFLLGSMAAQCCPDFPLLCSDSPGHPFKVKINRHLRRCLRVSASVTYKSTLPSSSPLAALHLPIYFNFKPVSSKRASAALLSSLELSHERQCKPSAEPKPRLSRTQTELARIC